MADTFTINPLHDLWNGLEIRPRLADVAEIHRGIAYNLLVPEHADRRFSEVPKPGFAPGLRQARKGFEPYLITDVQYLNMDPDLVLNEAYKLPWEQAKVIVGVAHAGRGPWTIVASIDERGLVCYQNFVGIWPHANWPLEVVAAVLNGPLASAFVDARSSRAGNPVRSLAAVPVPDFSAAQRQAIVALVRQYRYYRE